MRSGVGLIALENITQEDLARLALKFADHYRNAELDETARKVLEANDPPLTHITRRDVARVDEIIPATIGQLPYNFVPCPAGSRRFCRDVGGAIVAMSRSTAFARKQFLKFSCLNISLSTEFGKQLTLGGCMPPQPVKCLKNDKFN